MPTRFLINQCQIITFLILKSDNIENSRIELKGIVLPVPSNQIKVTFIIILPFNLEQYICDFFLFHIDIEGKCGWIIGGGGPKGILAHALSNYWRGLPPPPPPLFLRLWYINQLTVKYSLTVECFTLRTELPCLWQNFLRPWNTSVDECMYGRYNSRSDNNTAQQVLITES